MTTNEIATPTLELVDGRRIPQLGSVVTPRSVRPERIDENVRLFDFELGEQQMDAIGGLDRGERIGPDPARFG